MIPKIRALKIASAISKALSQIFYCDFASSIQIADVHLSKDLRYSDVFLYKGGDVDIEELSKISGFLQHRLTKHINLRYIPKLRFHVTDDELYLDQAAVDLKNDKSDE